jgi:hypothetical protein
MSLLLREIGLNTPAISRTQSLPLPIYEQSNLTLQKKKAESVGWKRGIPIRELRSCQLKQLEK